MAYANEVGTRLRTFTADLLPASNGSNFVQDWGMLAAASSQITDSSEPENPPNCLRFTLNPGHPGGSNAGKLFTSLGTGRREVYFAQTWRASSPWQPGNNGTKINFLLANGIFNCGLIMQGSGPYFVQLYFPNQVAVNTHVPNTTGDAIGTRNFNPNVGSGQLLLNKWYRIEMYTKHSTTVSSQDGVLRVWLDGQLTISHTNVNFPQLDFVEAEVQCLWGSIPTDRITQQCWFDYGHIIINLPNITNPTPPPTISSFTPTSGTFGTPITIVGTNFNQSPSANAVTLNNTACTVLGATTTQINTAVPNNATTGRIRVITGAGAATSSTDFTVQQPQPTGDGMLTGSRTASANTILSNEGTLDWAHWGLTVATSFNHKSGANLLSDALVVNATNGKNRYITSPTTYTWVSGTPTASATSTPTGIFSDGTISFTAPADTTERILRVYGGCFNTPSMRVRATLSDNSASPYTDTGLSSSLTESTTNAVWTMRYKAGSAGQLLTVDISLTAGDGSLGNVALQAATLQLANAPTESITLSPSSLTIEVSDDPDIPSPPGVFTLTINPARPSATVVLLNSSAPSTATVAASVTIPSNIMTAPVPVQGVAAGTTTITATLGSNTSTASVTVVGAPEEPGEPTGPATPSLNLYTSFLDVYRWM
jgi:hypothetical protein